MHGRFHPWFGPLLLGALTLGLHLPGLSWGLPSQYGWAPDELLPETVLDAWNHGFAGGWSSKYPPLHFMLLGLLDKLLLRLHGLDPAQPLPGDVYHALFVAGRALSLLLAAGAVALVHACGRLLLDARGALFAALLTATLLPFGFYGKLANLDVPYLFWALVSLWAALRACERRRPLALAGAAVAAVLAVATKDQAYGLYVLGAPLLLWVYRRRHAAPARDLWGAAAAAALAFALAFNLPFNWSGFVEHLRLITGPASAEFQLYPPTPAGQWALARQSAVNLAFVLGLPGLAVCLLGVVSAALQGLTARRRAGGGPAPVRRPGLLPLLVPAVSYYVSFVAVVLYCYDRFLLPVAVLLAFFGGRVLSEATAWPGWQGRLGRLAALIVVSYGAARCVSLDALMLNDARYAAEDFLAVHVAGAERVAGAGTLAHLPRLDRAGQPWMVLPPSLQALAATRPEWLVVNADLGRRAPEGSGKARFYEHLRDGTAGYRRVFAARWRARGLFFDPERLQDGRYGPVLSNLERVNPEIEIYRRAGVNPARSSAARE